MSSRNWLRYRLPGQTLVSVALVQASTNLLMILGKNTFGRVRPVDLLASTDWSAMWFMGGGSFPSGHGAFYFGLLLPLAASTSRIWLRTLLLGIAVFVVLARINMERHYLSDVCASALIAACVVRSLAWLRLCAIAGQGLTIAFVTWVLDLPIPVGSLCAGIAMLAVFSVLAFWRLRQRTRIAAWEPVAHIAVDTLVLGYLLYLTGGASNPFISLLVMPITLAATALPLRSVSIVAVLSVGT